MIAISKWSHLIEKGVRDPKLRMDESSGLIGADGRWSGFLPGFRISGDLWFDTNITLIIFLAWACLDAP